MKNSFLKDLLENKDHTKVVLKKLVKITPGKTHAWYDSNIGLVRKPIIKAR